MVDQNFKLSQRTRHRNAFDFSLKQGAFRGNNFDVETILVHKLLGVGGRKQFLTFGNRIIDCTYVEEGLFGEMIHFAVDDHVEAANHFFDRNHYTFDTGKLLCHSKGLRQEALNATCAVYGKAVFI